MTGSHKEAMMLADELEAVAKSLRRIADMPPNEQPSYPNGIRPWSTNEANHNAEVAERACAALRAAEPAQVGDADRAFELWFFRDIVDDQRSKLIALMLGGAVAKEATNHGTQRLCLKHILKALRAQGRAAEPAPEDVDMVAAENAAGSANLVTCDGYYEFDLEALTQAFAKHRALGIAQGRAEATAEIVALRRHTEWISTALHVLRGMCRSAGLKQGAAKADEMIQVTEELLRGDHRESE